VTWQVEGTTGGAPAVGTISDTGVFSAPPSVPANGSVTVSAVSVADPSKSASAVVTLMPPVASSPTVPGLQASVISSGSVTLTWTVSSDSGGPGIGGYFVYRNGTQIISVAGATTYTDTPLTAATTYTYQVAAFDNASPPKVSALTAPLKVLTLPVAQAPTVPVGLAASNIATGSITLSWNAASEAGAGAASIAGYYVYRNGTQVASVSNGTTFTDTPLSASMTYSYQVAAFDNASPANVSTLSAMLSVNTLADTQAPMVPTGLAVTSNTSTAVALAWNASTDLPVPGATGVGGYQLFRNGTQIATVSSGTTYNDTGVSASTTYSYRVAAFDKATPTNVSAQSAPLSVATPGPLTVTPHSAQLTLGQSQQFATNAPSGLALTWSVDGTVGGNSSVGTVSSTGLYTPPSSGGTHTLRVAATTNSSYYGTAAIAVTNLQGILTYQSDLARSGRGCVKRRDSYGLVGCDSEFRAAGT
jgi:hypothetical protein